MLENMPNEIDEQERRTWLRQAEHLRQGALNDQLATWREQQAVGGQYSLSYRILEELTKDAVAKTTESTQDRAYELEERLHEARSLVWELEKATKTWESIRGGSKIKLDFWRHAENPLQLVRDHPNGTLLYKDQVEQTATAYLSQPLRSLLYDRTLVDVLLACEIFLFADEMYGQRKQPWWYTWRQLRNGQLRSPYAISTGSVAKLAFWPWIVGTGVLAIIAAATAAIAEWLVDGLGIWIVAAMGAWWLMNNALTIMEFPKLSRKLADWRNVVDGLTDRMLVTYAQMQSDGVISARHILDSAKKAAEAGVVWPAPLFVVLEDVIARGGRL
jgi:hypothetical protein